MVTFEHAYDRVCAALRTLQLLTGESALTGAAYVAQERADEDYEVGSDYLNACWFPYGLAAPSMGLEQKEGELILYANRADRGQEEIVYHLNEVRWPECEGERTYEVEEAVTAALGALRKEGGL